MEACLREAISDYEFVLILEHLGTFTMNASSRLTTVSICLPRQSAKSSSSFNHLMLGIHMAPNPKIVKVHTCAEGQLQNEI